MTVSRLELSFALFLQLDTFPVIISLFNFVILAGPSSGSFIYITRILRALWARAGINKYQQLVVMPTEKAEA
ncbi:hypothetical protein F5Y05DRAFT_377230 [Hypoxylon sp. FL0543]|nr:hypothetical protein F5Y05DRAFT_377230 [Hypoxylon sp. FL0543]